MAQTLSLEKSFQEQFQEWVYTVREPEWIREMRRFYNEHGGYRPEDLRRLLGDPNKGVSLPPCTGDAEKDTEAIRKYLREYFTK